MTDVRDILLPPLMAQMGHYATVAENATDFTDTIEVIIPDFDEDLRWGPCRWMARDAVSLPLRGDKCFVQFDNRMNPWIVVWWPFD